MVSAVSLAAQGIAILAGLGLLGLVLTAQAGLILQMLINRMLSRRVAAGRISRSANDDVYRKLLIKAMWPATWRTAPGSVLSVRLSKGMSAAAGNILILSDDVSVGEKCVIR